MTPKNDEFDLGIEDTNFEDGFVDLLGDVKDTTPEVTSLLWELRQIAEASDASNLKEFLVSIRTGSPARIAALIQACPTEILLEMAQGIEKDIAQNFAKIAGQDHSLSYADAQALVSNFRDFRSVSRTIHSDAEKVEALLGNAQEIPDEDTDLPAFESLKNLNKVEIEKLFKMVGHDALIVAFANGADNVCDAFTTVMNKRAANMLLEDIDDAKNIEPKLIEVARRTIQEAAKSLSVMGEIDLS
jgi:hypothetical protein